MVNLLQSRRNRSISFQDILQILLTSLVISVLLVWGSLAHGQTTLEGSIQWTEDTARQEALKNIEYDLDTRALNPLDPAFIENLKALEQSEVSIANREITRFDGGYYAVAYDGERQVHYYDGHGNLIKASVCSKPFGLPAQYPRKCVEYAYPSGKFITVSLDVAQNESYIFKPNGELVYHWQRETGFDPNGNLMYERW